MRQLVRPLVPAWRSGAALQHLAAVGRALLDHLEPSPMDWEPSAASCVLKKSAQEGEMPELHELRKLAAWFRDFAERAGDPGIWERRLRTAEHLEAEADRIEAVQVGLTGKMLQADRKAL